MSARTCNRKPCELTQFETTWRMALPAARASCRACHVRFRHDVEPEERFKPNRNKYHAVVAARKRTDTVGEIGSLVRGHGVGWLSCPEVAHVASPAAARPTRTRRHRPHRPRRVPPRQPLPPAA